MSTWARPLPISWSLLRGYVQQYGCFRFSSLFFSVFFLLVRIVIVASAYRATTPIPLPFPSLPFPRFSACHPHRPATSLSLSQSSLCFSFREALYIHLAIYRRLFVVRAIAVLVLLLHVVEGLYAYTRAQRAGHKDTAPLWFIQTVIIGYPSTRLVMRLLS